MKELCIRGCCCSVCGIDLFPESMVEVCPDCGAIFCEDCADELDIHVCEDEYQ